MTNANICAIDITRKNSYNYIPKSEKQLRQAAAFIEKSDDYLKEEGNT